MRLRLGLYVADIAEKVGISTEQFSTEDVCLTQEIAQLKIHVERLIGWIKTLKENRKKINLMRLYPLQCTIGI